MAVPAPAPVLAHIPASIAKPTPTPAKEGCQDSEWDSGTYSQSAALPGPAPSPATLPGPAPPPDQGPALPPDQEQALPPSPSPAPATALAPVSAQVPAPALAPGPGGAPGPSVPDSSEGDIGTSSLSLVLEHIQRNITQCSLCCHSYTLPKVSRANWDPAKHRQLINQKTTTNMVFCCFSCIIAMVPKTVEI